MRKQTGWKNQPAEYQQTPRPTHQDDFSLHFLHRAMWRRIRPPHRLQIANFALWELFLRGRYDTESLGSSRDRSMFHAPPTNHRGEDGPDYQIAPLADQTSPPFRSFLLRQDRQPLHAQIEPEQRSRRPSGHIQLIAVGAGEADVGSRQIPSGIAADHLSLGADDLNLAHPVVSHIKVAVGVQRDPGPVRCQFDLPPCWAGQPGLSARPVCRGRSPDKPESGSSGFPPPEAPCLQAAERSRWGTPARSPP